MTKEGFSANMFIRGVKMENTTKILILPSNVIELPITKTEDKRDFIYTEFPYKHLLPKLEAA